MNRDAFKKTVLDFAQLTDKEKIQFPNPRQFSLGEIAKGILFIFAVWSGPSVHAWKALTKTLNQKMFDVPIYVLDADELLEEFVDNDLKRMPHGNGESFWIQNGNIARSLSKYGDDRADEILEFTQKLMND